MFGVISIWDVDSRERLAHKISRLGDISACSMPLQVNAESNGVGDVNPGIPDNVDRVRSWKYSDISDSAQLNALKLPDPLTASKVVRLLYTHNGFGLLALASNSSHKLWKWRRNEQNMSAESPSALSNPLFCQLDHEVDMSNDLSGSRSTEESAACFDISKNDCYAISAFGGNCSLFCIRRIQVISTFTPPPPKATCLVFHPRNNNVLAVGMEDSSILIYHIRDYEVEAKLEGHHKKVTGLAFSETLNVLVSSGADARVCVWNMDGWEKKRTKAIQAPPGHTRRLFGETTVQFNSDHSRLLVVHESHIAIYNAQLECLRLWYPRVARSSVIMTGTYSCDGSLVYVGFCNGVVGIFDSDSLRIRCRIAPSAYMSSSISSSSSSSAYPVVIAPHTRDPSQFALGMSNGAVYIIEPLTTEVKRGN